MPPAGSSEPNTVGMKMEYYSLSDIGRIREKNEDSYLTVAGPNKDFLALVCDGIGGCQAGEVASATVCNYLANVFAKHKAFKDACAAVTFLKEEISRASDSVYRLAKKKEELAGMGTTISGILFSSVGIFSFNAGDSRVYGISEQIEQLTVDHTLVHDLLAKELITAEEALNHPQKHYITKFLGIGKGAAVDVKKVDNYAYYLVSSDGLHGYVSDEAILAVMKEHTSLKDKGQQLLHLALEAGGYDNITLILLKPTKGDLYGC